MDTGRAKVDGDPQSALGSKPPCLRPSCQATQPPRRQTQRRSGRAAAPAPGPGLPGVSWAARGPRRRPLLPCALFFPLRCAAPGLLLGGRALVTGPCEGVGAGLVVGVTGTALWVPGQRWRGLVRVLWGPQGVVGSTLVPLCLNEGHVSELRDTHRRGWPRHGLCQGLPVCSGGGGRPVRPSLTRGTVDRELSSPRARLVMVELCLAPAGPPGVLSAPGARGPSGWVWLQQSHRLLGEGPLPVCGGCPSSELGSPPPAEGLSTPLQPRVVSSLQSSVRPQRGLVALSSASVSPRPLPPHRFPMCRLHPPSWFPSLISQHSRHSEAPADA